MSTIYKYDKEVNSDTRVIVSYPTKDLDLRELSLIPCAVCGYCITDKHHILPKSKSGNFYHDDNVVYLCPNHHRAIHVLMKFSDPKYYDEHCIDCDIVLGQLIYLDIIDLLCLEYFENKIKPIWIRNHIKMHGNDPTKTST